MEKSFYSHKEQLHRWVLLLLLILGGVMSAMASNTYYYNVKVTAWDAYSNSTGGGTVYVGKNESDLPTGYNRQYIWGQGWVNVEFNKYSTSNNQNGNNNGDDYATNTFYYYAIPDENYIFSHWVDGDPASTNKLSEEENFSLTRRFDGSENERTKFLTYAIFTKQTGLIKVQSSDATRGGVSISDPDNVSGESVTLTASPDVSHGIKFEGWKKGNTGEYVSKANPYTLTANDETAGTYWAYFSEPATKIYCRIKNNKTGNFLSIYGSKDKRAAEHKTTYVYNGTTYYPADGFKFDNCLKMLSPDDAQGNPTTVFNRVGHNQVQGIVTDINLTAQGVSYSDYIGSTSNYQLTMETSNGVTRIYTNYIVTVSGRTQNIKSYLCDEGNGWAVMKGIDNGTDDVKKSAEWTVYLLDENTTDGAFGANTKAKFTKDQKYYTTMYTDFAYQLLDGVKAYYLVASEEYYDKEKNIVKFVELEKGADDTYKVPARFPVVLETSEVQNDAKTDSEVKNRLLPLYETVQSPVSEGNTIVLQGYLSYNGELRTNNKKYMYVLSSFNGVLGFYHSNNATMTPNKAYLDISLYSSGSKITELAKSVKFTFGEPDEVKPEDPLLTGIVFSELSVDEDESTPVFDLNGRKVAVGKAAEKMLRPGVYVKKGKKFVVK